MRLIDAPGFGIRCGAYGRFVSITFAGRRTGGVVVTEDAIADAREEAYLDGQIQAWGEILKTARGHISVTIGAVAKDRDALLLEHVDVVSALRSVCEDFGDNDWSNNDHLADVIEKHLARHLHASAMHKEVVAAKSFVAALRAASSDAEREHMLDHVREHVCLDCGSLHLPCYCTRDD